MQRIAEAQPGIEPVILLDVEGVVLFPDDKPPKEAIPFIEDDFTEDPFWHYYPETVELVKRLHGMTTLHFMTSLYNRASEQLVPQMGLPEIAWVDFTVAERDTGDNLNNDRRGAINDLFPTHPIVWVDDNLTWYDFAWADIRSDEQPTLLVQPDSRHGIKNEHVDTISEWLGALAQV